MVGLAQDPCHLLMVQVHTWYHHRHQCIQILTIQCLLLLPILPTWVLQEVGHMLLLLGPSHLDYGLVITSILTTPTCSLFYMYYNNYFITIQS